VAATNPRFSSASILLFNEFVIFGNCGRDQPSRRLGVWATWPKAKIKCLPDVLTALEMKLPSQLARIAASSPQHVSSGLLYYGQIGIRRWPSVFVPVARTTAKSR
jgi:hypothetical protein